MCLRVCFNQRTVLPFVRVNGLFMATLDSFNPYIVYPAILQFCLGLEIKEHMLCIRSSMILQSDICMMLVIILCMIYRKNINIVTSSTFNVIKTLLYGLKIVKLAWQF